MDAQTHRNRQLLTWGAIFVVVRLASFVGTGPTIHTRREATKAAIAQVCEAMDLFKLEQQRLPVRLQDLVERPSYIGNNRWPVGGYLHRLPRDAWDRDFLFRVPGSKGRPFEVVSDWPDKWR